MYLYLGDGQAVVPLLGALCDIVAAVPLAQHDGSSMVKVNIDSLQVSKHRSVCVLSLSPDIGTQGFQALDNVFVLAVAQGKDSRERIQMLADASQVSAKHSLLISD